MKHCGLQVRRTKPIVAAYHAHTAIPSSGLWCERGMPVLEAAAPSIYSRSHWQQLVTCQLGKGALIICAGRAAQ